MPGGSTSFKGSSAASTGALTLGDLNINAPGGSYSAGMKWWQIVLIVVIPGGLIIGGVWYFLKKRK